jgi:hypothetical protein
LERWHFYDTGLVWLKLIERFATKVPYERIERLPPDAVLAQVLGMDSTKAEALLRTVSGELYSQAAAAAALVSRSFQEHGADTQTPSSAERLLPVKVFFGQPTTLTRRQAVLPDGGIRTTLDFDGNEVAHDGPAESFCCPTGASLRVSVSGRTAMIDGKSYPLDQPGTATGLLELSLDHLSIRMPRAELRVFRDSLIVIPLEPT